jgi:hypothetical protein
VTATAQRSATQISHVAPVRAWLASSTWASEVDLVVLAVEVRELARPGAGRVRSARRRNMPQDENFA